VLSKPLARVLRELLGSEVAICNSLYFERGSQQPYHIDTFYMAGPQRRPDTLIVTSICLEDHHPDAGRLTYYPGSHKIPAHHLSTGDVQAVPEEMDDVTAYLDGEIAARSLETEDFAGKAGDVFIWHEQLYHGGRPIADPSRTRKSLVTHETSVEDLPLPPDWFEGEDGPVPLVPPAAHQQVPA
jgi:phytanoyl-CoA hydroxylase